MKNQQKNKRQFFCILVVSWALMLIFAALYVQQLQKEKAWKEAGELTDVSELEALRADYASAVARYDQAEEKEAERKKVNDTVLSFLDAYFLLPDSREALLSGCENYVAEDAWRTLELLSKNKKYNSNERELFYYREDCTEHEEDDGIYEAFAIFTIREIDGNKASDQSYMLAVTVEADEESAEITDIQTLTEIYYHADLKFLKTTLFLLNKCKTKIQFKKKDQGFE